MPLSERDQAEVDRSAEEARKLVIAPISRVQVERYLNPPPDTSFPLEYAFHLLGDVRGKTVLDFGCGAGENIIPLLERGAHVIGLDISPDLIGVARRRLADAVAHADLRIASAYATSLPDESIDVIFSMALIHHLEIDPVLREMQRILAKGGKVILREPIRFSSRYAYLRNLLPARGDISEYEHPLTTEEFSKICAPFAIGGLRYFRFPLVPLLQRVGAQDWPWAFDGWLLRHLRILQRYATVAVVCLTKTY